MFRSKAPSALSHHSGLGENNEIENHLALSNQVLSVPISAVEVTSSKGATVNSIATSSSGKKLLRLPVLYTKQVNKKRKSYSEGFLKLVSLNGMVRGSLIDSGDLREIPLESRYLQAAECQLFKSRTPHTLKFEKHLIEVSFDNEQSTNTVATNSSELVAGLHPKRFIPPKPYVPPSLVQNETEDSGNLTHTAISTPSSARTATAISYGRYSVPEDELDAIWGGPPAANVPQSFISFPKEINPSKYRRTDNDVNLAELRKAKSSNASFTRKHKEVTFATGKEIHNQENFSHIEEESINRTQYQVKKFIPPVQTNTEGDEEEIVDDQPSFLDPFNLGQDIWND